MFREMTPVTFSFWPEHTLQAPQSYGDLKPKKHPIYGYRLVSLDVEPTTAPEPLGSLNKKSRNFFYSAFIVLYF